MPGDGTDYIGTDWGGYQDINDLKDKFASAVEPANHQKGQFWYDTGNKELKKSDGISTESVISVYGAAPVGSIISVVMGYFGDGSNGSYSRVLGASNDAAGVNGVYNALGWYVCDGAAVNVASTLIWNAAARYVPNLTDDRFLMGDTAAGGTGGSSTMAHTHPCDPPSTTTTACSATEAISDLGPVENAATEDHTHDVDVAEFNTGAASDTKNRPLYLACIYIVRVF